MTYYMIQRLYNRSSLSENPYAQSELQRKVSVQSLKQELVENISTELTIDNQQLRLMDCIGEGKKQEAALVSVKNVCYTNTCQESLGWCTVLIGSQVKYAVISQLLLL